MLKIGDDMDLVKYFRHTYLRKHSKGIWVTKDGTKIFVEDLDDRHLMSIPYFLAHKSSRSRLIDTINDIPEPIREEIKERNMILNDDFTVTRKIEKTVQKSVNKPERRKIRAMPWR